MTESEALKLMKIEKECINRDCDRDCAKCDIVQELDDLNIAYDMAINALEKQIPKKPIKDKYSHDCCPNCGWIVYTDEYGGRFLNHCENCGQSIDWSE